MPLQIDLNTNNNTDILLQSNNTISNTTNNNNNTKTLNHLSNPLVRSITNINASQQIRDIEGGWSTDTWQAKHFPRGIDIDIIINRLDILDTIYYRYILFITIIIYIIC